MSGTWALGTFVSATLLNGCESESAPSFDPWREEATRRLEALPGVDKARSGGRPTDGWSAVVESSVPTSDCQELANRAERTVAEAVVGYPGEQNIEVVAKCNDTFARPSGDRAVSLDQLASKYGLERASAGTRPS